MDLGGDDRRHLTPLMRACKNNRLDLVTALVDEHGAAVNVQAERSSLTALIVAAYDGNDELVKFLLKRGADPHLANKWGESAIVSARKHGKHATANLIETMYPQIQAAVRQQRQHQQQQAQPQHR
jgi:ankyrin repeat protein